MKLIHKLLLIAFVLGFAACQDLTKLDGLQDNPNAVSPDKAGINFLYNQIQLSFNGFFGDTRGLSASVARELALQATNYSGFGATTIGQGFVGAIDEVGIWTEALDADDIKELFEKVKVENQSVLTCQLPVATNTGTLSFQGLTLRETTTRIGDISQTMTRTITVDNDLPVVQIQTPSNGQYVSGDDIVSIAGAATDATSYVGGVRVREAYVPPGATIHQNGTATWNRRDRVSPWIPAPTTRRRLPRVESIRLSRIDSVNGPRMGTDATDGARRCRHGGEAGKPH